ncbi:VOC family protein [Streptomyces sp. XM4193]|uniref:VOC family protein n=1 Tax=Streptomyces sp. XM4193 TaxID=2929782 RepID=UPI001FFB1AB2|nr:VOC family protein [Streptomyces sp. XM4193]MCK1795947.1 VOC family protein [Streptomyces sp. XM4193]
MITTDFVPGAPCWIDLGVPDGRAAADFYRSVFGWELEPLTADDEQGYGLLRHEGRAVGALGPLGEEGARSSWMIYFMAADVRACADAVRELGGTVRVPPFDAGGAGTMAQATDPQGAEFAVFQPGGRKGFETADVPGALCWVELMTTDRARADDFYRGLFGWTGQDVPMPGEAGGAYELVTAEGQPEERMHGGVVEVPPEALELRNGKPYWHPVFATEDCDAAVERVTSAGGTLQMGPEEAEGVGRLAVVADPFGAEFVVLDPSPADG